MTLMGGTSLDDNIKNNFNIFRKYQDCKALKLEPTTPKMYTPTFKVKQPRKPSHNQEQYE